MVGQVEQILDMRKGCLLIKTLLFAILTASIFAPVFSATLVGKGTSSQTNKGDLRIVFPLSEKATFTSFRLENPARLVIDIPQAQLREKVTALSIKSRYVQGVRLGTQQGTDLRIVVDMSQAMPASTALVKGRGGYELVILVNQDQSKPDEAIVLKRKGETIVSEQKAVQVAQSVAKKQVLIMIDPGHGGKDPGALGTLGSREKTIVLAISRQLRDRINKERGMRAVLTRDSDVFIPLRERFLIARRNKADMFISIHADAGSRSADGASVYVLSTSGASSEAAKMLAEKENMSDMVGGVKISDKDNAIASMLLDISQDATIEASHELGKNILNNVQKHARLHKRNVERAGFAVLKAPDIPSVLVETGFISNPSEERKLVTKSHQAKLADDILQGVKAYYRARPATELVYSTVRQEATPVVTVTAPPKAVSKVTESPRKQSANPPINLVSKGKENAPPPIKLTGTSNQTKPVQTSVSASYTVKRGESLDDIAKINKVDSNKLKQANNLPTNQLRVPVGTQLIIP